MPADVLSAQAMMAVQQRMCPSPRRELHASGGRGPATCYAWVTPRCTKPAGMASGGHHVCKVLPWLAHRCHWSQCYALHAASSESAKRRTAPRQGQQTQ